MWILGLKRLRASVEWLRQCALCDWTGGVPYYVLIDLVRGMDGKIFGSRSERTDRAHKMDINSVDMHFTI